jgi:hypothetical protein
MKPGDKAIWNYTAPGGYGFVIPVDAEVVKVNPKTVRIRATNRLGKMVERNVKPASLRARLAEMGGEN